MISWPDALDVYEASLGHHRGLIDSETVEGASPWPPFELPIGPVPEDLRDRAAELLDRSHLLIDDLASKMANLPALKASRHAHHGTPDRPRWTAKL